MHVPKQTHSLPLQRLGWQLGSSYPVSIDDRKKHTPRRTHIPHMHIHAYTHVHTRAHTPHPPHGMIRSCLSPVFYLSAVLSRFTWAALRAERPVTGMIFTCSPDRLELSVIRTGFFVTVEGKPRPFLGPLVATTCNWALDPREWVSDGKWPWV